MQMTNEQLIQWVEQQKNKQSLQQCANGLGLNASGSRNALKQRICAHLQTLQPENYAAWNWDPSTTPPKKQPSASEIALSAFVFAIIALVVSIAGNLYFIVFQDDDTGFNRDQIVQIVNQTNYDNCVHDVEELNSVIPDPANMLDPATTCS